MNRTASGMNITQKQSPPPAARHRVVRVKPRTRNLNHKLCMAFSCRRVPPKMFFCLLLFCLCGCGGKQPARGAQLVIILTTDSGEQGSTSAAHGSATHTFNSSSNFIKVRERRSFYCLTSEVDLQFTVTRQDSHSLLADVCVRGHV